MRDRDRTDRSTWPASPDGLRASSRNARPGRRQARRADRAVAPGARRRATPTSARSPSSNAEPSWLPVPAKAHGIDGRRCTTSGPTRPERSGSTERPSTVTTSQPSTRPAPNRRRRADRRGAAARRSESATWLRADLARHIATLLPDRRRRSAARGRRRDRPARRPRRARCVALGPDQHGPTPTRRATGREHVTDRRSPPRRSSTRRLAFRSGPSAATGPSDRRRRPAVRRGRGDRRHARWSWSSAPPAPARPAPPPTPSRRSRPSSRPVVGLAPSGKAADVLAPEAGCPDRHPRRVPHPPPHRTPAAGPPGPP